MDDFFYELEKLNGIEVLEKLYHLDVWNDIKDEFSIVTIEELTKSVARYLNKITTGKNGISTSDIIKHRDRIVDQIFNDESILSFDGDEND